MSMKNKLSQILSVAWAGMGLILTACQQAVKYLLSYLKLRFFDILTYLPGR